MKTYISLEQLILSVDRIMLKYAYDNLQVVRYSHIKTDSLTDYVIGKFTYFMCWFVNFCSVREEFWPEEFSKQVLEKVQGYVIEQFEKFSGIVNPIEYRFLCAYINSIKTHRLTCPGKELARSYLREIVVSAKRMYSIQYDDPLQTLVNKIVKFNLDTNDKIWDLPNVMDMNGEFMTYPNNATEANKLLKRKKQIGKIVKSMNSSVEKMKDKLTHKNIRKEYEVKSPKVYKYRNSQQ